MTLYGQSAGSISIADLYLNSGLEKYVRGTVSAVCENSQLASHSLSEADTLNFLDHEFWVCRDYSRIERDAPRDGVDQLRQCDARVRRERDHK